MACVVGLIIWLNILFGYDKAPLGVPATILAMFVALELGSLIGIPLRLARAARGPGGTFEVQAEDDGITIRSGRNTRFLPWKVFSGVWMYDDFIILPVGPIVMSQFVWVPRAGMSSEVSGAFRTAKERLASQRKH
jgi:hypothetical protein